MVPPEEVREVEGRFMSGLGSQGPGEVLGPPGVKRRTRGDGRGSSPRRDYESVQVVICIFNRWRAWEST